MFRDPRPGNVYHLGVEASIPMKSLSEAFGESLSEYSVCYFLPLPQSFTPSEAVYGKLSAERNAFPTVADSMDAVLFSPTSHRKKPNTNTRHRHH